jgi:hypothetical protein
MNGDGMPYDDTYQNELIRLSTLQTRAAEDYAAQKLLIRIGHTGTTPARREEIAEEAAQRWIASHEAICALNAAEYRKKCAVEAAR